MKTIFSLFITLFVIVSFTGCKAAGYSPSQTETAYGYVHGGYVGRAVVTVDDVGAIDVELDDAFLPHTLAVVDPDSDKWTSVNTTFYMNHGRKTVVAKYIEYLGKTYIAVRTGTGISYVEANEKGEAAGNIDLEKVIIRNQANMAAFFEAVPAGKFKVLTGFGGEAIPVTTTSYGGVTKKTAPGYWNTGQTWIGNIKAIEVFAEENGVQFSLSEMKKAEQENAEGLKLWSVADTVTGATNSDFKDYFGLIQFAVGKLKSL